MGLFVVLQCVAAAASGCCRLCSFGGLQQGSRGAAPDCCCVSCHQQHKHEELCCWRVSQIDLASPAGASMLKYMYIHIIVRTRYCLCKDSNTFVTIIHRTLEVSPAKLELHHFPSTGIDIFVTYSCKA